MMQFFIYQLAKIELYRNIHRLPRRNQAHPKTSFWQLLTETKILGEKFGSRTILFKHTFWSSVFSRHLPHGRCRDAFMQILFAAVSNKVRKTVSTFNNKRHLKKVFAFSKTKTFKFFKRIECFSTIVQKDVDDTYGVKTVKFIKSQL